MKPSPFGRGLGEGFAFCYNVSGIGANGGTLTRPLRGHPLPQGGRGLTRPPPTKPDTCRGSDNAGRLSDIRHGAGRAKLSHINPLKIGTTIASGSQESNGRCERGRGAMVALTENAVSAIRRVMDGAEGEPVGLRIMVQMGGCSGLQYLLGLESAAQDGDAVFDCGGVKVFVDPGSQPVLENVSIDFVDSLNGSGFVFDNPNAQDVCSCGKSFAA